MVARTESELILAERLTAAGHDVKTIADPGQIGQELAQSDFNIVLTLFAERQVVARQMQIAEGVRRWIERWKCLIWYAYPVPDNASTPTHTSSQVACVSAQPSPWRWCASRNF